ncbi:hypothetical protein M0R19_02690 [Candidatus Pacearchaeota archaeon]|nr:hypothetical protein [Candidatus Pacearchaeota archaeon]
MRGKKGQNRSFSLCNFFPKNRRGSHVGMILSFVIFITFIVFLYVVLRPSVTTSEDKKATLTYIERQILENVSANFTSTSVSIDKNIPESCVSILNLLLIPELSPPGIKVKNKDGIIQQEIYVQTNSPNLLIDRSPVSDFFYVYSSPEWEFIEENSRDDCKAVGDDKYQIGVVKEAEYPFEENLIEFMNYYKTNYEDLKKALKTPPGAEFGFGFIQSNQSEISVGTPAKTANVYAEVLPIQYIDDSANIQSGFINIRVW